MASPSSAGGRGCGLRWLDSNPSTVGSASPAAPRSFRAVLCEGPLASSKGDSQPLPRPGLRSEVHRVSFEAPWEAARGRKRPRRRSPRRRRTDPTSPRRSPHAAAPGECPRCYSTGHPRSECRRAICCRRCRFPGHVARDCPNPRSPAPSAEPPSKRRCGSPPRPRLPPASPSPSSPDASVAGPSHPALSGCGGRSSPASTSSSRSSQSNSSNTSSRTPVVLSGHPALRPASAVCYLPRTARLVAAETELRERALTATVAGNRSGIGREEVTGLLRE
ncbi:hypothetical protein VPH35_105717 [Triticum aestivum]